MKTVQLIGLSVLLSTAVACASQAVPEGNGTGSESSAELTQPAPIEATQHGQPAPAERGCTPLPPRNGSGSAPTGGNPAAAYCGELGYALSTAGCAFPDGTSCEPWAFYRGECGQAHSFCNLHGGSVANKIEDMGGWTASYAVCTLPSGTQCHEDAFAHSCTCE